MCELIQDYICKHCAGDLYIEKKIDKDNQSIPSYKAIIYCKNCASHVEICSYSAKDFNNNIKDVLELIGMKKKSNTSINKIPTFYNQYQYMNYQEAIELLNELLLKGNFTDQYGDMDDSSPYEEAINIAIKAIEKQIPQKLKIETLECMIQGYSYMDKCCVCPSCGEFRGNLDYESFKIKKYSFCPDCGQALDWSVTQ